jgi:Flp pilus assembly protein TadD
MGVLSNQKGDPARALRFLSRAVAIDPLNASAHYNLSRSYQLEGRVVEAENELREAEALAKQKGKAAPR